jgi:hypothetical protein
LLLIVASIIVIEIIREDEGREEGEIRLPPLKHGNDATGDRVMILVSHLAY